MTPNVVGDIVMGAIKNQWLAVVMGVLTFAGGYQVRGYQVTQHEQRLVQLEQSAPSAREWQDLNKRLERMEAAQVRIEQKVDHLAEVKADKH